MGIALLNYEYIDTTERLSEACRILHLEPVVAFDLECASGLHHYEKRVCLMQLASKDETYIIDVLADLDFASVRAVLEDPNVEIIMHDADFDMRSLDRDYGWRPRNIFDTLIAARMCGHRKFGLGSLLEKYFAVSSSKKFQRADWMKRPLTKEMLEYAAGDVHHLIGLRDILYKRLEELGRIEWASERFAGRENLRFEPDLRPLFARVKRAKEQCSGRELAVLKELAEARESIAARLDLPPFKIISDEKLIALAKRPPKSEADLAKRRGMHPYCGGRGAAVLVSATRRGVRAREIKWPLPPRRGRRARLTPGLLERLKRWRQDKAEEFDLEPDLILSMGSMKRLAAGASVRDVVQDSASRKLPGIDLMKSLERHIRDLK